MPTAVTAVHHLRLEKSCSSTATATLCCFNGSTASQAAFKLGNSTNADACTEGMTGRGKVTMRGKASLRSKAPVNSTVTSVHSVANPQFEGLRLSKCCFVLWC